MSHSELIRDLIQDFQQQRSDLDSKIELIDPIATSIRQPAASRLINNSLLVIGEYIMYILAIAFLGLTIFTNKVPILNTWFTASEIGEVIDRIPENDLLWFEVAYKGLFFLLALCFVWIGRMLVKFRHKNSILHLAAKDMNALVEVLFKRKVEMEQLENKFDDILPISAEGNISTSSIEKYIATVSITTDTDATQEDTHIDTDDIDPNLLDPDHKDTIL